MHVTFIVTGGTIFQTKCPETGCMVLGATIADLVSPDWLATAGVTSSQTVDLKVRSGAELTYDTIFAARDAMLVRLRQPRPTTSEPSGQDAERPTASCIAHAASISASLPASAPAQSAPRQAFVLVTGTDTLEEFAFCMELLLGAAVAGRAVLVITGAMKPYDIEGYDGRCNLRQAVQVATCPHAFGVLVVLNDDIHTARYVRKADSQLMGAFRSHPGPVGQLRAGRVRFYYGPTPDAAAWCDPRLASLNADAVRPYGNRVAIWVTGVSSGCVPEGLLQELYGLVVSAPGTGSLSVELVDQLAPYTARIPIVIASRCEVGENFDDFYYRGSLDKYERRGFLLSDFSAFNAVQARNLLVLRLAAGVYPQYTRR